MNIHIFNKQNKAVFNEGRHKGEQNHLHAMPLDSSCSHFKKDFCCFPYMPLTTRGGQERAWLLLFRSQTGLGDNKDTAYVY